MPRAHDIPTNLGIHDSPRIKNMNAESIGLVIFALIALGAVFAFIVVFGGPPDTTGYLSGEQKPGTSWYKTRDEFEACARGAHCSDGMPGIPTGNYDTLRELYECKCQTSEPSFTFWRSAYQWG